MQTGKKNKQNIRSNIIKQKIKQRMLEQRRQRKLDEEFVRFVSLPYT